MLSFNAVSKAFDVTALFFGGGVPVGKGTIGIYSPVRWLCCSLDYLLASAPTAVETVTVLFFG